MDIHIRNYQESDAEQLEHLTLTTFPNDDAMQAYAHYGKPRHTPTFAHTVVAQDADNLVGFASVYQNSLHYHPHDFRVVVIVTENYQRQGLGTRLHRAVLTHLPVKIARLREMTLETSPAGTFLEKLGYQPLFRSFGHELVVDKVDVSVYQPLLRRLEQNGYTFKTLADLDKSSISSDIILLCLEAYADMHVHSPPTPNANWNEIFLDDDCIDEAFFVALKEGQPVGFSSLQAGETSAQMESMWDGVARSERTLAFPLRLALKLHEVDYAQKHGVKVLAWEVDDVDLVGMQLMRHLPFKILPAHQLWVCDVWDDSLDE
ncbi:MAG: GNAT family N-acetyltransferase [Deinococcota bacterium]